MLRILFPILPLILLAISAEAATTYTTSTGAVFTQIQGPGSFGLAWKDPSGMIWSSNLGEFTNGGNPPDKDWNITGSPATKACVKIGGTLPTEQQYQNLAAYFDQDDQRNLTVQGQKDLVAIFPDMQSDWFWSSTWDPDMMNGAFDFNVGYPAFETGGGRDGIASVRCVGQ